MSDRGDENPCSERGLILPENQRSLEKRSLSSRDGEDGEGPRAVTLLYASG